MTHIILVDDDQNILASVSMALEAEGFKITAYNDSETAYEALLQDPPDLAILDIKMPRLSGTELFKKLKAKINIPVIFLTSLADEDDQFIGLQLGADDYITKPFSQRLLVERIKAVLRRQVARRETLAALITQGHLQLDAAQHRCFWRGVALEVTVTEFLLIEALFQNIGHIKTRDQLLAHAYGNNLEVDARTIDSHIKRLRKKFRDIDPNFDAIETIYGIGYRCKNV